LAGWSSKFRLSPKLDDKEVEVIETTATILASAQVIGRIPGGFCLARIGCWRKNF